MRANSYLMFGFICHWSAPLTKSIQYVEAAHQLAVQVGNLAYAAYSVPFIIEYALFKGAPLSEVGLRIGVNGQQFKSLLFYYTELILVI
jgi:hypothetical protein